MGKVKVIELGDLPNFTQFETDYALYSALGFAGQVLAPTYGSGTPIYTNMWSPTAINFSLVTPLWTAVGTPPSNAPAYNWLRSDVIPGFDWFDDMTNVIANFVGLTKLAKDSFCRGIFLDNETYAYQLFQYSTQTNAGSHTFADYKTRVQAIAYQLGISMWTAWPSCQIFITGNYWLDVADTGHAPEDRQYGLFSVFLDGLLNSMADYPCAKLIIGNEFSYACKIDSCFAYGVRNSTTNIDYAGITGNSPEFTTHATIAMATNVTNAPFDNTTPNANYFTPTSLTDTLVLASGYTDKYLWVYTGGFGWVQDAGSGILNAAYDSSILNALPLMP